MRRREFITETAARLAALYGAVNLVGCQTAGANTDTKRPNIVLLFADDLGWGELGAQGGKDVATPHIDSIARDGARFTNGYVSCPVCSPTRAGMLTGRYQQRFGHEFNPGNEQQAPENFGLPLDQKTAGDRLRAAGYATGWIGKSHQGYKPEFNPTHRGFDEFYGFLAGARAYFPNNSASNPAPMLRGTERVQEDFDYTTFAFAREANSFIERHKDGPFFLYLPFNAVHSPLQAPESHLARFAHINDTKRRTFCAMLSALDDAVGQVLDSLAKNGLTENTLVFFISDNGGPTPQTSSSNGPLRATKGTVYEGGIRVPFFLKWPGHVKPGTVCDTPVIALDMLPTALAAAGATTNDPLLEGGDLVGYLHDEKKQPLHEALFWRFGKQYAVRHGDWKLLVSLKGDGKPELYNLRDDIGEENDLASKEPARVAELQALYDAWNAKNIPPLWNNKAANATPAEEGRPAGRRPRRRIAQ